MPMGRGICIALIRVCGAFYVTKVTFARPGPWAIEIIAGEGNGFDTARVKVTVLDSPPTPMLGSTCTTRPEPRRQRRSRSAPDRYQRATRSSAASSSNRGCYHTGQASGHCVCDSAVLHQPDVRADCLRSCEDYSPCMPDRVVFTHQEIWQDFAGKKLFPTVTEWRLQSEPWIFLVDAQGIIRAKFEGLPTVHEFGNGPGTNADAGNTPSSMSL